MKKLDKFLASKLKRLPLPIKSILYLSYRRFYYFIEIIKMFFKIFSNKHILKKHISELSYARDNLWVDRISLDWMKDKKFKMVYNDATKSYNELYDKPNYEWRIHVIIGMANYAMFLKGDFVDLGVHEGVYAYALKKYFGKNPANKTYYLLDSYEGLDPKISDEIEIRTHGDTYAKDVSGRIKRINQKFPKSENYCVIKGYLPKTLDYVKSNKICYLSLDLNSAQAENLSLRKIWPKLIKGAVIIFDDYGRRPKQRKVADIFAKETKNLIITLPTGQGIMFKTN